MAGERLRVAHTLAGCETLGPGRRFVIWVAGCGRRCPGCIAEPILGNDAGRWLEVDAVVERILASDGIDGVTLSGGEPFEQAAALAVLCDLLRAARDLSILAFSGHLRSELEHRADPGVQALYRHLDVLVDGPFVQTRHADLLWRGSSNQRIHILTPRHADLAGAVDESGAGLEFHLGPTGRVFWAGVPGPGFVDRLAGRMRDRGIGWTEVDGFWT